MTWRVNIALILAYAAGMIAPTSFEANVCAAVLVAVACYLAWSR